MIPRVSSWPCLVLAGCLYSLSANAANDAAGTADWSYVGSNGPSHWGMLSPAFELCDTGKSQSPINLERKKTRVPYSLSIDYRAVAMAVNHDNHWWFQLEVPQSIKEKVVYQGKEYKLVEFHFHSPSETLWHKQSFPLEIHFVHESKDKQLLELAVFVNGGEVENAALKEIEAHLQDSEIQKTGDTPMKIDLAALLPTDKRYYAYNGSRTTPPCVEGVQWIVMSKPVIATPAQILRIRQRIGGSNARPVQPLNGRVLSYAVE